MVIHGDHGDHDVHVHFESKTKTFCRRANLYVWLVRHIIWAKVQSCKNWNNSQSLTILYCFASVLKLTVINLDIITCLMWPMQCLSVISNKLNQTGEKTSHLSFYNSVSSSRCLPAREDGEGVGGAEWGEQQQHREAAGGRRGPPSEGAATAAGRLLCPSDEGVGLLLLHHLLHLLHGRRPAYHRKLSARTKICWVNWNISTD